MRKPTVVLLGILFAGTWACGDDGGGGDLFPTKPECTGDSIAALAGTQPQVISKLEIGTSDDGFDLDHDGKPDNKLAAIGSAAKSAIADALNAYALVLPIEFFDLPAAAADTCVKFAVYLGAAVKDADADGNLPMIAVGDCNDHDPAIKAGQPEVAGNGKDDDCDGLADEDDQDAPNTTDTMDRDGDGQTVAQGDCDDTNAAVKHGAVEICGDGLDNDCDGVADRTVRAGMQPVCSPFDRGVAEISLDPTSFVSGEPAVAFRDGVITEQDGTLRLEAGPSVFSVNIPVTDGVTLDLKITGATIKADVVDEGGAIVLKNGRLGGVIDSKTADTIRGLKVDLLGLLPENSLLDATFANLLGSLLALPRANADISQKYSGCRTPDIDVDQDGLEAYCDSCADPTVDHCPLDDMGNPKDPKIVDTCIDGDGTEVKDVVDDAGVVIMQCSEAVKDGKSRFVDGISVELNFETTAVKKLISPAN
ncbi:MAG: putative lipoprotein [Deltaproteobacteria bacterium]|nr:putative lipoprotein [Deltaproteobacteria bacterium]